MTNSELFSDNTETNSNPTETPVVSKYDNWEKEALIKKALAADEHINKLETEHSQYKSIQKTDETLQEVLRRLEQPQNPVQNTEVNHTQEKSGSSDSLSKEEVQKLVTSYVEEQQKKSQAKTNVERIKTELQKTWGDDYRSKVSSRAQDLGVPQSYLELMAESHPDAFLKLILPQTDTPKPNTHVPPKTTQPIQDNSFKGESYREFRAKEKENPALLYDGEFQRRKLEAAQKFGDAFYR